MAVSGNAHFALRILASLIRRDADFIHFTLFAPANYAATLANALEL